MDNNTDTSRLIQKSKTKKKSFNLGELFFVQACSLTHERCECDFENSLDKPQFGIKHIGTKRSDPLPLKEISDEDLNVFG